MTVNYDRRNVTLQMDRGATQANSKKVLSEWIFSTDLPTTPNP